jgi:predicted amidohydrolase
VRDPPVVAVAQPPCVAHDVAANARTHAAVAQVGAPLRDGPHIAVLAVDGDRATVAYRKMWLGGEEPERFVPGDAPAALDVDGRRLGLAACKDVGVPQHAADTAALGIDVYVAGTGEVPDDAARQEANARRIASDHGVWVAVASFAGPTGVGYERTAGRSGVWAPGGAVIAQAGPEPGAVATATISA